MSYQVLARKYRPASFSALAGQEHVLKALVNALDHNRLHHAYLFTGTRGVGKTTIARILARCLNCEQGISSSPCGECSSCREIAEGRSVDLLELDAASRTGVDNMRELLDNVQYLPTRARFKIYLIDEVHMLSNSAFNALLKTLEEPPEHVKFLFATTDPKKLPVTVLSRCLQFNLKNLPPEQIVEYLKSVLEAEQIDYEEPALWQLGRAADGSMRDALSLTDQAIAFGENRVGDNDVRSMLGAIDQRQVYLLLDALIEQDAAKLLAVIAEMASFGPDFEALLSDLLSMLHRIAVAQAIPDGIDNSQGDKELVDAVAAAISREDVQLFYQIALIGSRDLPLAPDPREGFEMVMLRMLSFQPDGAESGVGDGGAGGDERASRKASPIKDILSRINGDKSATGTARNKSESAKPLANKEPSAEREPLAYKEPSARKEPSAQQEPSAHKEPSAPIESTADETPRAKPETQAKPEPPPQPEPAAETADPGIVGDDDAAAGDSTRLTSLRELVSTDQWCEVFDSLGLSGVAGTLAANCILTAVDHDCLTLTLEEAHKSLHTELQEARIVKALSGHLGRAVRINIIVGSVAKETPAALKERIEKEDKARAVEAIENDENVKRLLETFDARINRESIVPRQHAGD